jgi:hypothetical protein
VQDFLGHADVRTTLEIYAQGVPELGKQAAAAMGGRFMPPSARHERAIDDGTADEGVEGQTRRKAP